MMRTWLMVAKTIGGGEQWWYSCLTLVIVIQSSAYDMVMW